MTVDEAIDELQRLSDIGYGKKPFKAFIPGVSREESCAREIRSIVYIGMRSYGRDFVEAV